MILDLVGFISTHFQPKPSHGDPFQANFFQIIDFFKPGNCAPAGYLRRTPQRKSTFFKTRVSRSGRLPSANTSPKIVFFLLTRYAKNPVC